MALQSNEDQVHKLEDAAKRESERTSGLIANSNHIIEELSKEVSYVLLINQLLADYIAMIFTHHNQVQ